ncbi:MAG TPA: N-acetylmuramoyl-L-alanine amidase [Bacillota bacterium]
MVRLVVRNVEIAHPDGGFLDPAQALWAAGRGMEIPFFHDVETNTVYLDSVVHGRVVVIDPAHGGRDRRAHGALGYHEADGTLSIALELAHLLRASGARVILTRAGDDHVPVAQRLAAARRERPALLLSLHTGGVRAGAGLSPAVIANCRRPFTSYRLAGLVAAEMVDVVGTPPFLRRFAWRARDVDGYCGLLLASGVPAVIIECGCHQYPEQERLLLNQDYRALCARAIYRGLCRYFQADLEELPGVPDELRAATERARAAAQSRRVVETQSEGPMPGEAVTDGAGAAGIKAAEARSEAAGPAKLEPPTQPPTPPPTQPPTPPPTRPPSEQAPLPPAAVKAGPPVARLPSITFAQGQVYQVAPPGSARLNVGVSGRAAEVIAGRGQEDTGMPPMPPEFTNWPAPKPAGSPTRPHG